MVVIFRVCWSTQARWFTKDGSTYFNGASLQNSGTAEVRSGGWSSNTGTNSFVNTGTLNKTTTNSFTIRADAAAERYGECAGGHADPFGW
jgi:hypothetical protein